MQLVVGRITRPHGVRGEVSVEVRTDEPDRRFAVGRVLATDPVAAGPLTVESARWHSGRLLIQFAGVADRNQAEDLRGIWLTLDSAEAGPTGDPDEFHDHELIGLAVVTTSGEPVGRVTDVRHFGQDLLVIEPQPTDAVKPQPAGPVGSGPPEAGQYRRAGGRGPALAPGGPARGTPDNELLVPFVAAIVPEVDLATGRLVIDPPPGLLELAAGESGQARAADTSAPDTRAAETSAGSASRHPRGQRADTARQAPVRHEPPGQQPARKQPARREPIQQEAEVSRVRIDIITIFPDYFTPLSVSLLGKAASRGDIELRVHDLRAWAHGVHRAVDDAPFGGGPGMVMSPEPWGEALDTVTGSAPAPARLVVPTPAGVPFTQAMAAEWARCGSLIFACGRYEGIDARVVDDARERMPVDEVSIGDYVLTGGEPAVLVMVDAVGRLLPGVLGNAVPAADDSFGAGGGPMAGLLEGPAYTRPRVWRGREVPPVLLSGDHAAIARWRRDQALRRTAALRPDLAARLAAGQAGAPLDARDRQVLIDAGFPISAEDMAH